MVKSCFNSLLGFISLMVFYFYDLSLVLESMKNKIKLDGKSAKGNVL